MSLVKEIWLRNKTKIKDEISELIQTKTSLLFVRPKQKAKKLIAVATTEDQTGSVLVLHHPEEFIDFSHTFTCYYHFEGKPLRGFTCTPGKKVEQFLGVSFPVEIFHMQRRKYKRVPAPSTSKATFSLEGKQRVIEGVLVDISRNGARIVGEFPNNLIVGSLLTPLCLRAYLRFRKKDETLIHVPEATIVRVVQPPKSLVVTEIGVNFKLPDKEVSAITRYIDYRMIEDEED